jgi:hypothetical protein
MKICIFLIFCIFLFSCNSKEKQESENFIHEDVVIESNVKKVEEKQDVVEYYSDGIERPYRHFYGNFSWQQNIDDITSSWLGDLDNSSEYDGIKIYTTEMDMAVSVKYLFYDNKLFQVAYINETNIYTSDVKDKLSMLQDEFGFFDNEEEILIAFDETIHSFYRYHNDYLSIIANIIKNNDKITIFSIIYYNPKTLEIIKEKYFDYEILMY